MERIELKTARCVLLRFPSRAALLLIRLYQGLVRPFLIGACKFHPSCSEYAMEAITIHGLIRGGLLTARRLMRCRPFSTGGIDPVPPARDVADVHARHPHDAGVPAR